MKRIIQLLEKLCGTECPNILKDLKNNKANNYIDSYFKALIHEQKKSIEINEVFVERALPCFQMRLFLNQEMLVQVFS